MRTLQDSPIDIPRHVNRLADVAVADPAVRSVVLYGSRAIGRERAGSDWDIALVTDGHRQPSKGIVDAGWNLSPKHGITVLSEDDMLAKMDVYASLASEVAQGVVLRGVNYEYGDRMMARRMFGTSTEEARDSYVAMMETMWDTLRQDILKVTRCRRSEYTVAPTGLGAGSADAAERVVKLVTLAHGLPFLRSHDVNELAGNLPEEWRDRIAALNGDTKMLHEATYGRRRIAADDMREVCEQTERRMSLTLEVANDLLAMRSPLTAADAKELRSLLADPTTARETQFMVRECSAVLPELVARFVAVRDGWLDRLLRDSIEQGQVPNPGPSLST